MNHVTLGQSGLSVTPICLGTMTFGEQVNEADAHAILDRSLARGVNFVAVSEDSACIAAALRALREAVQMPAAEPPGALSSRSGPHA